MQIISFTGKSSNVRDIKPDNILIDSKDGNNIKLIDFSSA